MINLTKHDGFDKAMHSLERATEDIFEASLQSGKFVEGDMADDFKKVMSEVSGLKVKLSEFFVEYLKKEGAIIN